MKGKDYEVGYGKPPKHTQWKKGHSPNPNGRPRGARGLRQDLEKELGERVPVTENGKRRMMTKQQVAVKALVNKAMKGDARANAKLLELIIRIFGLEETVPGAAALPESDQLIIEAYLNRRGGKDPS